MKLIIVDDEAAVRGSIRMLSNPEMLGFTTVEEACDGIEALKKLEKTKFDVMITDMRMPGMDGVKLLNSIREDELPTTIVVSAYHDFEYMRLAMHKHAVDYILKPIKQVELVTALRKAAQNSNKNSNEGENEKLNTIWWDLSGYPKKEFLRLIERLNDRDVAFDLIYLKCLGFKDILKQKYGDSKELMFYHIEQSIIDVCAKRNFNYELILLRETAEILLVLYNNCEDIQYLEGEFTNAVFSKGSVACFCQSLRGEMGLKKLFHNYECLRKKVSNFVWEALNCALNYENERKDLTDRFFTQIEIESANSIKNLDITIVLDSIKALDEFYFSAQKMTISDIENIAAAFLRGLMDGLAKSGISLVDALEGFEGYPNLAAWMGNKNSFFAWMESITKTCVDYSFALKRKKCSYAMKEMLEYVELNCTLDLGLDDLTKRFHLSREHISRMFKRETGENFITYLTKLRMKKAVELILEAQFSMQIIAEKVGFNDASYFSRSFKKSFGISPEDYRKKFNGI